MINHRFRIAISLTIAFFVVNLYGRISPDTFFSPIQTENIKRLFASIEFPTLDLKRVFTLRSNPIDNKITNQLNNSNSSFNLPSAPLKPTEFDYAQPSVIPTDQPSPTFEIVNSQLTKPVPTVSITKSITLTTKPTSKPKATPTSKPATITTSQRPGTTLTEIFNEVQKRECIPAALLYAFQTQETGPWWPINTSSSKVKIYNKYGWWLDGSGNSCTGMGYHTQTGIVPEDAVDSGSVCQDALGGYDQAIMGILQISQSEEDAAKKYMTGIINGNIDRRVLFDNAVIFAIITKNRLGTPPSNCNDWPEDAIREAAEKHYGSCGDNYCTNILNYYRQYKKS